MELGHWAKAKVSFQMAWLLGFNRSHVMVGTEGRASILLLLLLAPDLGAAAACCALLEGRIHPCLTAVVMLILATLGLLRASRGCCMCW